MTSENITPAAVHLAFMKQVSLNSKAVPLAEQFTVCSDSSNDDDWWNWDK